MLTSFLRKFPKDCNVLVTTPIFYINADPHIGHLYSLILSDYLKKRLQGFGLDTWLSTGTDEHGQKVLQAADALNLEPKQHCDNKAQIFKDLANTFEIDYDCFIRTTEKDHCDTAQHFWGFLTEQNVIYKDTYEGWYSVREETFFTERELIKNEETGQFFTKEGDVVEYVQEENYMLRMSEKTEKDFEARTLLIGILPEKQRNRILSLISNSVTN